MIRIDSAVLFVATSTRGERYCSAPCTGYLSRRTGEIVFVFDDEAAGAAEIGAPYPELIRARRRVEASRADWLEIPRYGDGDEVEELLREFLSKNGIDAQLT